MIARRRLAAGLGLVVPLSLAVGAFLTAGACSSSRPHPCERPLTVVADDSTPMALRELRCDDALGQSPAAIVWTDGRRGSGDWSTALQSMTEQGRGMWIYDASAGWSTQRSDQLWSDMQALAEALADEPWTDPGRVALIVDHDAASRQLADAPPESPLGAVGALVWLGDANLNRDAVSSSATFAPEDGVPPSLEQIAAWLADEFAFGGTSSTPNKTADADGNGA